MQYMKIEDAIKQQTFESEYHKLNTNLLFTGSWINHQQINLLRQYDISPQQHNVLRILESRFPNPATVNLLIDNMIDNASNVSRLVEKLRKKGLVERKQCLSNRRAVDITLTNDGFELLKQINNRRLNENIMKSLTLDEARQLNNLLDKLRD